MFTFILNKVTLLLTPVKNKHPIRYFDDISIEETGSDGLNELIFT